MGAAGHGTSGGRSEVAAGGVVFRRGGRGVEVVVAEQRDRHTGAATVRLPKGKLEPGEQAPEAALREVAEETGLRVRLREPLGDVDYTYRHREGFAVAKRVHFFLMEHESGEPSPADGEMERVLWCPLEEALARLSFGPEIEMVRRAEQRLRDA